MVEITPSLIGNSLVLMIIVYFIAFAFNIYMLYLNWKQSKVKDTTQQMLEEIKKTNQLLEELKQLKRREYEKEKRAK